MRREAWLVLAAQALGDLGRETTKDDSVGIDEPPLARDLTRLSYVGLHSSPSLGARNGAGRKKAQDNRHLPRESNGSRGIGATAPTRVIFDRNQAQTVGWGYGPGSRAIPGFEDRGHLGRRPAALTHVNERPR